MTTCDPDRSPGLAEPVCRQVAERTGGAVSFDRHWRPAVQGAVGHVVGLRSAAGEAWVAKLFSAQQATRAATEVHALRLAAPVLGTLAPHVVADVQLARQGVHCIVMSRLPGDRWSDLRPRLDLGQRTRVVADLGSLLRRLHTVGGPAFGSLLEGGRRWASGLERLLHLRHEEPETIPDLRDAYGPLEDSDTRRLQVHAALRAMAEHTWVVTDRPQGWRESAARLEGIVEEHVSGPRHRVATDPDGASRQAPRSFPTDRRHMADNELETVRSIMKDVRVAMLTTTSPDGTLMTRPMATQEAEFDGDAWFVTARDSDLAREIAERPAVNVAYSGASSWLSLSGCAEVVVDDAKKAQLWNNFVEAWFPGGKDDAGIVLLKVASESGQYWDSPGRVASMVDMAKARITGSQAGDVGESGTVQL